MPNFKVLHEKDAHYLVSIRQRVSDKYDILQNYACFVEQPVTNILGLSALERFKYTIGWNQHIEAISRFLSIYTYFEKGHILRPLIPNIIAIVYKVWM